MKTLEDLIKDKKVSVKALRTLALKHIKVFEKRAEDDDDLARRQDWFNVKIQFENFFNVKNE